MEAKELMLGDFVYHKVKNIDGSFRTDIEQLNEGILRELLSGTSIYFSIEDYSPIPLTSEILEKNGWYATEFCHEYWKNGNILQACLPDMRGRFGTAFVIDHFKCEYVHQYQHLLRLCGLIELVDSMII